MLRRHAIFSGFALLLLVGCFKESLPPPSSETTRGPRGNPDAEIVLEVYANLDCPGCGAAYDTVIRPLLKEHGSRVRVDFQHFSTRAFRPHALKAGEAAECLADQGMFWAFVEIAYHRQAELDAHAPERWATELGADMELYRHCIASGVKSGLMLAEDAEGKRLGLTIAPTFILNGKILPRDFELVNQLLVTELQ